MATRKMIDDFFSQKTLALVRTSPQGPKFGNIFTELTDRGYKIFLVCPGNKNGDVENCFETLTDLPEPVGGIIITLPKNQTVDIVHQAAEAKIPRVWMQLDSDSKEAIQFCENKGIQVIHGECIMMFAEPVKSIHGFHRWIWKILGKLPN